MRKVHGYNRREMNEWHRTRAAAFTMARLFGFKENIEKFWPFEEKEGQEKKEVSVDELRQRIKMAHKFYNNL